MVEGDGLENRYSEQSESRVRIPPSPPESFMNNPRKYGGEPFTIAVIHGGPGAAGEMAPVAKEISAYRSVMEPFQTATSLEGQVEELKSAIEEYGKPPMTLVGYSWGAWLVFIVAAKYPGLVKKLILVGSGPFESKYAQEILKLRLDRLNEQERNEIQELLKELESSHTENSDALKRVGELLLKTDSYNPSPEGKEYIEVQQHIYQSVWTEANELRRSGKLLQLGEKIKCPVVAIHGDYDPHPAEGVRGPLSRAVKDFKFILLENCGHTPWIEQIAKGEFYEILKNLLD